MPRTFMDNEARWFPEGSLTEMPAIEGHREDFDIRSWSTSPQFDDLDADIPAGTPMDHPLFPLLRAG